MSDFNKTVEEFGKVLGKLKQAYADEYGASADDLLVMVDKDNYLSILPNNTTGTYVEFFRDRIDVELE